MKRKLTLSKNTDEEDEIKQSFYGVVGMQPKNWFPYDRPDKEAWLRIKDKLKLTSPEISQKQRTHTGEILPKG